MRYIFLKYNHNSVDLLRIKNHAEWAENHKNENVDVQGFGLNLDDTSPLTIPIQRDNLSSTQDSIDRVTQQLDAKKNEFEKGNNLFRKSIRYINFIIEQNSVMIFFLIF
jgi:hypothetical protein